MELYYWGEDSVAINGKTYSHREFLKKEGYVWNGDEKHWERPFDEDQYKDRKHVEFMSDWVDYKNRTKFWKVKIYKENSTTIEKMYSKEYKKYKRQLFKKANTVTIGCTCDLIDEVVCKLCQYACCNKAKKIECNCEGIAFLCKEHGEKHYGKHK